MDDSRIKNKSKNQILSELVGTAEPGSRVHEQQKMAIFVRCTEDLENALNSLKDSINKSSEISYKLANKVYYLNIILTIATVIGTLIAVAMFFYK